MDREEEITGGEPIQLLSPYNIECTLFPPCNGNANLVLTRRDQGGILQTALYSGTNGAGKEYPVAQ